MPILGNTTVVAARVTRSATNALRVQLSTPDGAELAQAKQKGGAAVLFGFKNGGKGDYSLSNAAGDELRIEVAATTTISRQNTTIGKIVPADGAARFEDAGGALLAVVQPHTGPKGDSAWHHEILSSAGQDLGVLTLMRIPLGWREIDAEVTQWLLDINVNKLKAPSAGVRLRLSAPVSAELGDVLTAACVDFSVLPRGYLAPSQ
jgi:hypothetical protein